MLKKNMFKKGLQLAVIYIWYKGALDPGLIKAFTKSSYHSFISPNLLYENPEQGIQKTCATILSHFNMTIFQEGLHQNVNLSRKTLFVCNHHSFLDVVVFKKILPDSAVVMRQDVSQELFFAFQKIMDYTVNHWNIIPYQRNNSESGKKVKQQMVQEWKDNNNVLVFPEGTTRRVIKTPFYPGSFRLALQEGVHIQPITLYYNNNHCCADDGTEDYHLDVVQYLKYVSHTKNNRCYLHFHPSIDTKKWTNSDYLQKHCEEVMIKKWNEYKEKDQNHELE